MVRPRASTRGAGAKSEERTLDRNAVAKKGRDEENAATGIESRDGKEIGRRIQLIDSLLGRRLRLREARRDREREIEKQQIQTPVSLRPLGDRRLLLRRSEVDRVEVIDRPNLAINKERERVACQAAHGFAVGTDDRPERR